MNRIQTEAAPAAIGPYSQGVTTDSAGRMVFLSGQVGLDPATGQMVAGDVRAQTEQVMKNLRAVLEAAGGGLEHLVKTTIFLHDLADFAAVNEVYARHLQPPYPARATVQVARLPRDAAVEIDGIAQVPAG
jgi:2-iminobutanoate/2-iminopropanoate deaminase